LFWGVMLPLRSTTHPDRSTSLKFAGTSNYGSYDASINLRERPWERFETIPLIGRGSLSIKHDLTLERLFRYSRNVKATDIRLGEKFHIKMNPRLLFWAGWWTSGDLDDAAGLGKKRFAKWERPDEDGTISNLMPGEQRPDVEQMEREGWVFSEIG